MPAPTSHPETHQQTVGQMFWQDAKAWMLLGAFAGAAYLYTTKAPSAEKAAAMPSCAQTNQAALGASSPDKSACFPSPANK